MRRSERIRGYRSTWEKKERRERERRKKNAAMEAKGIERREEIRERK